MLAFFADEFEYIRLKMIHRLLRAALWPLGSIQLVIDLADVIVVHVDIKWMAALQDSGAVVAQTQIRIPRREILILML